MGKLTMLAAAGNFAVVLVLTTGCMTEPPHAEACVDWVRFEDPQDQFDQAALVIIGKPVKQDGETNMYGYTARTYLVEIETVLKGEQGQKTVLISSTPQTCTGGVSYPDGDPLDTNQRVLVFANKQDNKWSTLTPQQGVLPLTGGTPLPFRSS